MTQCEECQEQGDCDCKHCNPCLGCKDYDAEKEICKSDSGCGEMKSDFEKLAKARKELEESIWEEILKPICDWLDKILKGEK